jgi:hypothetical protein
MTPWLAACVKNVAEHLFFVACHIDLDGAKAQALGQQITEDPRQFAGRVARWNVHQQIVRVRQGMKAVLA